MMRLMVSIVLLAACILVGCASHPCDPKIAALAVQMMGEEGRCR